MLNISLITHRLSAAALCLVLLAGCTPRYDWRTVRGEDAPFSVLLPAKPAHFARPVHLDGITVPMSMTAAKVDGVAFAVGSAELADAAQVEQALQAMKRAMVANIQGTVRQETTSRSTAADGLPLTTIELEAGGSAGPKAPPQLLLARFVSHQRRVYQVVVLGPEAAVPADARELFFSSFQLH